MTQQIRDLEKLIVTLLKSPEAQAQAKAQSLQQMQGIAAVSAATLLAELPELGSLSDAQVSSLAGLAPHPYDSGPMRGQRHIQGGRTRCAGCSTWPHCALFGSTQSSKLFSTPRATGKTVQGRHHCRYA